MNDPLLASIDSPDALKKLDVGELSRLAVEIRQYLIQSVSQTGGHLAASLGTVELTLALHYVFQTPGDRIVWDVGHQAYSHKILTGRREAMKHLRQKGGISGFPRREESPYDSFGVGHSSTSISAALGMAIAAKQLGQPYQAIAVIGDGAMTAGQAFEALNHAGDLQANLLVILNDNEMSISPNVGALSNYFARVLSGRFYASMREGSRRVLSHMPPMQELARRAEEHFKGMVVPGTLFEELGFNYIGPVDGHDISTLIATLKNLKALSGPRFLHVVTRKGKGYPPAEADPRSYHGVGRFDPETGEPLRQGKDQKSLTYTEVFGRWLCAMAAKDPGLVAITPAMTEGSGMQSFAEKFPRRFFDVGIAEQHSVTLAAGLACEGLKPVVAIYSTFLQRAYDQLVHDVALQNLPVLFAIDRAGLVGPDGPTHAGVFDISFLQAIPNLTLMAPADETECWQMLTTGLSLPGPSCVRYPRDYGTTGSLHEDFATLPVGKALLSCQGEKVALLVFGHLLNTALTVAEFFHATVVNMRFIKPLDLAMIEEIMATHQYVVTLEENVVLGGAGMAIAREIALRNPSLPVLNLGLPDQFIAHGSRSELLALCGLDNQGIHASITEWLKKLS